MSNHDDETAHGEVIAARKDYPLLASPQTRDRVLDLIEENLGGAKFSPRDLSRIKVPSGDDTQFKIETASGIERRTSLTGVITAFRQARAYWKRPFGTGKSGPPDCSSKDGFTGEGDPGGSCTSCPYAAFGTARAADGGSGPGQACKDLREMLILLPGQMLPHLLACPPTSLTNFTKYSLNLISAGLSYWTVTTRLTLEPATSQGGVRYARIGFALYGNLNEHEVTMLAPYHERMRGLLAPMTVDTTSYEIYGPGDGSEPEPDPDRPF